MTTYKSPVHGLRSRSIEGHDVVEGGGASLWSAIQLGAAGRALGGLHVLGGDIHLGPIHGTFDAGEGALTGTNDE